MFSNPEFSQNNLMPFLGLLGASLNKNSNNPFTGALNNVMQMQMLKQMREASTPVPSYPSQPEMALPAIASSNGASPSMSFDSNPSSPVASPTQGGLLSKSINSITQSMNNGINNSLSRIAQAIGMVESSNNYKALGPQTRKGDRAYGKYQVMGNNIPVWTQEILGQRLTPQQFLENPAAQDQVALGKMGQYHKRFGTPHDVASMWFSGRPAENNWRKDVTGTSVPQYMQRVISYLK